VVPAKKDDRSILNRTPDKSLTGTGWNGLEWLLRHNYGITEDMIDQINGVFHLKFFEKAGPMVIHSAGTQA
jgi:hypothetical protein